MDYIWDGKLTTSHLINRIERFITERGLLDWFTTDRAVISRRPRWKARFTNALIQLVILGCLETNEDGYSRTDKGEECLAGIYLHVNANAKQCYIVGFGEHIENPDNPLIRDVIIEGLSLARTQKEEFASIIETNNGELSGLFDKLKEFVNK